MQTPFPHDRLLIRPLSARLSHGILLLFAGAVFLIPAGVSVSLAALWLLLFIQRPPRQFWHHPVILFTALTALYCLLHAVITNPIDGGGIAAQWHSTLAWLSLTSFIPVAWAINGNVRRVLPLLAAAATGFIINLFVRLNWPLLFDDPARYLQSRDGFGFVTIAFGLYSASVLLGFIFIGYRRIITPQQRWYVTVAFGLLTVFVAQSLLLTQSRGTWLAFIVASAMGLWWQQRQYGLTFTRRGRVLVIVFVAALGISNSTFIYHRLTQEAPAVQALITANSPAAPSSIGIRWHAQQFGIAQWQQRPWCGWGAGATPVLLANSAAHQQALLTDHGQLVRHLHNSYLEILVQFGLVGLWLIAAVVVALLLSLRRAFMRRALPSDMFIWLIAVWVLLLIWSAFDFRAAHHDWLGYWSLFAGITFGITQRWQLARRSAFTRRQPRILLIRLSAIGDILFATPLIASVRRTYPQAYLAWLVQPEYASLLTHHPDLNSVITWPHTQWRVLSRQGNVQALWRQLRTLTAELRRQQFDIAIDLQGLLKSSLPAVLSVAPERISLGGREGSRLLMTQVIARQGVTQQISSEYYYLAQQLRFNTTPFHLAVYYDDAAQHAAAALRAIHGLTPSHYLVLCPFTTRPQKHWPETDWAELIQILAANELPLLLIGAPADRAAAERIAHLANNPHHLHNVVGQTELLTAIALIAAARAVIGVDTGLSHASVALQRPTVLLFGATCPYLTTGLMTTRILYQPRPCSPCRRRPICGGQFNCMCDLTMTMVLTALHDLAGISIERRGS